MTARPFDVLDHATWPDSLTPEQVAAIYQRSVGGVKKACQLRKFRPAPHARLPYRWRKVDVLRDLGVIEGRPLISMRRAG